ncbi:hypothetical protein CHELA1G2_14182 [Hyphomicrobiales bacterium]|nr:hypothetical protein CHELA1G2_14182 [Hyphomicrobiales bacterium]
MTAAHSGLPSRNAPANLPGHAPGRLASPRPTIRSLETLPLSDNNQGSTSAALERVHAAERPPAVIRPELIPRFRELMPTNPTECTI